MNLDSETGNIENVTIRGLVQIPPGSTLVTDADEEVFLLYTELQRGASTNQPGNFRGLGHVDSRKDSLSLKFELQSSDQLNHRAIGRKGSRTTRKAGNNNSTREKLIEIEIVQDKTALRSRKGDTGSVLWMAGIEFAQLILQQHHSGSHNSLLNPVLLASSHVLEIGAGTGLLSIALSPLVRHYTVTDVDNLIPLIRKNISLNFPNWPDANSRGSNITVAPLDWQILHSTQPSLRTHLLPSPSPASADPIDLVLLVDCIYNPALLPSLLTTLDFLSTPGTTVILVIVELRSEEVIREFLDMWIRDPLNWEVRRIGSELMGMPYAVWVGWRS